jgi:hypothetical protein
MYVKCWPLFFCFSGCGLPFKPNHCCLSMLPCLMLRFWGWIVECVSYPRWCVLSETGGAEDVLTCLLFCSPFSVSSHNCQNGFRVLGLQHKVYTSFSSLLFFGNRASDSEHISCVTDQWLLDAFVHLLHDISAFAISRIAKSWPSTAPGGLSLC